MTQRRRMERDLVREAAVARMRAELEKSLRQRAGWTRPSLRALVYIRLPEGSVDERGFRTLEADPEMRPAGKRMSCARLKASFNEQFMLLCWTRSAR